MGKVLIDKTVAAFRGGLNSAVERVQLKSGEFSTLKNIVHKHPGFKKRKGHTEHNSTNVTNDKTVTMFQISKGRRTERRFFRQLWDNSASLYTVEEASANPPSTSTTFGTTRLTGVAGAIPASWAVYNDVLLYADKARQGQYFAGQRYPLHSIMYYSQAGAPNISPTAARNLTDELKDDGNTLKASVVLDNVGEVLYVGIGHKINRLYFKIGATPNTAAVTLAVKYHNQGYLESAVTTLSDGTASGGATMAVDGGVSWDSMANDQPVLMFGVHLYWYKIQASGATDTFDITSITGEFVDNTDDSPAFNALQNVWDGAPIQAIEAHKYSARTQNYSVYGGGSIFLGGFDTDDYLYFNFPFPIYGLMIHVGSSPHKNKALLQGGADFQFTANASDSVLDTLEFFGERTFSEMGFEASMSVVITNSTTNNGTYTIHSVSGRKMFFRGNSFTTTEVGGASTLITYTGTLSLTASADVFEAFNDVGGWTALGVAAIDGTNGITESGLVLWAGKVVSFSKKPFRDSQYSSYWYRMSVNDITTPSVNISIEGLVYPIGDPNVGQAAAIGDGMQSTFGLARTVATWKNRAVWTFDFLPHYAYISSQGGFNILNGNDFGVVRMGDGRTNAVLAMAQFYNELVVLQEEKGVKGGCVTVLEGNLPAEYGTLVLSDEIGIVNGKAYAMVDGIKVQRESAIKSIVERLKLLFFLSRHGIMVTDGQVIYQVAAEARNYFDPQDSNSLRAGYEDQHYLWANKDRGGLEIGLVTGATATTPNTFLFYDLMDGVVSEDTFAQGISCGASVEADSGDTAVLAMRGGSTTGVVYRVNGLDDVSTAVDMDVVMELNGDGKRIQLDRVALRLKRQSSGTLTLSHAINGSTVFTSGNGARALDMSTGSGTDTYRRYDETLEKPKGDLISLRFRNNEAGTEAYLQDVSISVSEVDTYGTNRD